MTIPKIKLDQNSCLLSIYQNEDPEEIYKHCPVMINTIPQFGPQILETTENILIFGVENNYQIICEYDNQPQSMQSLSYAVFSKMLMCKYHIITSNYFLKGYLCEKSEPEGMTIKIYNTFICCGMCIWSKVYLYLLGQKWWETLSSIQLASVQVMAGLWREHELHMHGQFQAIHGSPDPIMIHMQMPYAK